MTRVAHFFQIDDVVAMVSLVILNHDSNQNDRARMNLHPSFFSSVSVGCPECGNAHKNVGSFGLGCFQQEHKP